MSEAGGTPTSDAVEPAGIVAGNSLPSHSAYKSGQVIMLGFTGSLGSGCSFLATGIKEVIGTDAHYFKLSQYIRDSLREKGQDRPTVAELQDEGNRLRQSVSLTYLVERCVRDVLEKEGRGEFNANSIILIDGIRNTSEVLTLRVNPNFYLVSVHATRKTRSERLVGPSKQFSTAEEFKAADDRDSEEEGIEWGQKVHLCNDLADIIVNNDQKISKNTVNRKQFFAKFISDYLAVVQALRDGVRVVDRPPSMDETLMTMAYCASRRSSCEKRKVGAVVAHAKTFVDIKELVKRKEDEKRYQVISSGYNEVPLGTAPCKLGERDRCYRDCLKDAALKYFKVCPQCGKNIPPGQAENFENLRRFTCGCGCELQACLPGAGDATGKMLDMCKALHAEETALLGLHGVSKNGGGELILYTTTFPCNLCANKIVQAGIKSVVFAEPYTMKEAEEILRLGGVKTRMFEGVKSSAYFRIYS
jgi:deoxycytidylate deaminase